MSEPRGIRGRRMDRSRGGSPISGSSPFGLLRQFRQAHLRWTSRRGYQRCRATTALATASAPCHRQNAPDCTAAANQPIWLTARAFAGALGPTELVVEVKFLTWTGEGLLRQVIYQGLREDKRAT